jgi:FdhD protein
MIKTNKTLKLQKYESGKKEYSLQNLDIIVEQPVDLVVDNKILITFYCSPFELDALALGFLWNEGVISDLSEIQNLSINFDNSRIDVSLLDPTNKPKSLIRTSTGITFMGESENRQLDNPLTIKAENLIQLYDEFSSKQNLHKSAGGFHSAALSDGENVNIIVEDLGRHNCLDKISGRFILDGKPFTPKTVLLSGRISSEMIHKVLKLSVPIIVSRTTPTTRAVEIAKINGITIIGYLRGNSFSIFTNPGRIRL